MSVMPVVISSSMRVRCILTFAVMILATSSGAQNGVATPMEGTGLEIVTGEWSPYVSPFNGWPIASRDDAFGLATEAAKQESFVTATCPLFSFSRSTSCTSCRCRRGKDHSGEDGKSYCGPLWTSGRVVTPRRAESMAQPPAAASSAGGALLDQTSRRIRSSP